MRDDFYVGSIDDPNPGFPNGDARRPSTYKTLMKMDSPKDLRVMFAVAHPDDAEARAGGTIAKLTAAGAKVVILTMTDGCRGHQTETMRTMIRRRREETEVVKKALGLADYIVGPVHDDELVASVENRAWLTHHVRRFAPHILITLRTCDYHTDHRAAAQLVQDMVYLLGVPLWCPDVPVPAVLPTVLYEKDGCQTPRPFRPDILSDVTDFHEKFLDGFSAHKSQCFEWTPPQGDLTVPPETDPAARRKLFADNFDCPKYAAEQYRAEFARAFGRVVPYGEVFEIGEYGRRPSERERKVLETIGFRWT